MMEKDRDIRECEVCTAKANRRVFQIIRSIVSTLRRRSVQASSLLEHEVDLRPEWKQSGMHLTETLLTDLHPCKIEFVSSDSVTKHCELVIQSAPGIMTTRLSAD